MDITIILNQLATLFLLIGTGFFLYKTGLLNTEFDKRLTKLLINVTMPLLIISSVLGLEEKAKVSTVLYVLASALSLYLILPVIGWLFARILFVPKEQRGLYIYMTTFSNVGFMGFPLIGALLGDEAVFYTALFNIIFSLASFSYGILLISSGGQKPNPRMLLSPGILLSLLAVILCFTGLSLPSAVTGAIDSVGGLTTPLAMLLIGASLASMKPGELFFDWRLYPYTALKQLLLPLSLYPLFRLFIRNTLLLHVCLILLSVPAANSSVLFATEYRGDEKLAARGVFLTTLFSAVTIPLVVAICL